MVKVPIKQTMDQEAALKKKLIRTQEERRITGPKRPLANLVKTEKKIRPWRTKLAEDVGKPIDKWINTIKEKELHKKAYNKVKNSNFIKDSANATRSIAAGTGDFAIGVGKSVAKRSISSLGKMLHSHTMDPLIWIGIVFFIIDWSVFGFSNTPTSWALNLIIAVVVLKVFLKRSMIVTGLGIVLLVLFWQGIGNISVYGFQYLNSVVMPIAAIISAIIVLKYLLKQDTEGLIGVIIVFLLQTGFLEVIATNIPFLFESEITKFLLVRQMWPYWLLLATYYGHKSQEGASKLINFFSTAWIFFILFMVVGLQFGVAGWPGLGQELSEKEKGQLDDFFEDKVSSQAQAWKRVMAPFICIGKIMNYNECVSNVTAPPTKPKGEDQILTAVNKKKGRVLDLQINGIDADRVIWSDENSEDNYENIEIFAQIKGEVAVDVSAVFECEINNFPAEVNPIEILIPKGDLNWYQDLKCRPFQRLKGGSNEITFRTSTNEVSITDYSIFVMDGCMLSKILNEYATASYSEIKQRCKNDKICLENLEKGLYQKISEFKKIKTTGFRSIPDNENANFLVETTQYPPVISIINGNEARISLRFGVQNNDINGRIKKVNEVKIYVPDYLKKEKEGSCILVKEGDYYKINEEELGKISWEEIEEGSKNQRILPGNCIFYLENAKDNFLDLMSLNQIDIVSFMDYTYELENSFKVRVLG